MVELAQVNATYCKGGYLSVIKRNAGQITTCAQKKCSLEYVCGLNVWGDRSSPPFARCLNFGRRCGRRKVLPASLPGCGPSAFLLAKVRKVGGLFCKKTIEQSTQLLSLYFYLSRCF